MQGIEISLKTLSVCLKIWSPSQFQIREMERKNKQVIGTKLSILLSSEKKLGVTDHQGDPQVLGCFAGDIMM